MKKRIACILAFVLALLCAGYPVGAAGPRTEFPPWEEVDALGAFPEWVRVEPRTVRVRAAMAQNSDTVGWLRIPGTDIDEVVLQDPSTSEDSAPNTYYLRRNFAGEYDWTGSCFADYRASFGGGAPEELSRFTTIYGNSNANDLSGEGFSQLLRFRGLEFFSQNQYIYFSTQSTDMVFRILCVSVVDISVPYNRPDWGNWESEQRVFATMFDNSANRFDTAVLTSRDKYILLSAPYYGEGQAFPSEDRLVLVCQLAYACPAVREENTVAETRTVNPSFGPPSFSEADQ